MKLMSFAMTTEQIAQRRKTVTRRCGWVWLKPGDLIQPVRKCMGLRRGEKVERIGGPIRVVSVRRERLDRMLEDCGYGFSEVALEGFAEDPVKRWPSQFVEFFAATHGCEIADEVTRIEFEYVD